MEFNTPTSDMTLTAHDVRALRHADAICFDHNRDGSGAIRAIRRAESTSSGFEETHTIHVVSSAMDYSRSTTDETTFSCFNMWHSAQYNDVARTLVRRMRAGKSVRLQWTGGNSSPVTDEARIVRDDLRILIGTPGKYDAETYLADTFVGRDNTARMVRIVARDNANVR